MLGATSASAKNKRVAAGGAIMDTRRNTSHDVNIADSYSIAAGPRKKVNIYTAELNGYITSDASISMVCPKPKDHYSIKQLRSTTSTTSNCEAKAPVRIIYPPRDIRGGTQA